MVETDSPIYIYSSSIVVLLCILLLSLATVLAIICRLKSHYNQLIESLYNTNDGKQ